MQKEILIIRDLSTIESSARDFLDFFIGDRVFAFYGDMGAGKTTFIRALCKELGVSQGVTSPTFAIINEYSAKEGVKIFHFDFYRINSLEEVFDFGYEEYFESDAYSLIEWPELIESLLPDHTTRILIQAREDGSRVLSSLE